MDETQNTDQPTADSVWKELDRPDYEVMEAKSLLVHQIEAAIRTRNLSRSEAARIVGVTVDEIDRVLRGVMRPYNVSRLGAWLDWIVSGRGFVYSDDDRNYGEEFSSPAMRWIDEANSRANGLFLRLRREIRGKIHPLRYEALLRRMEHIVIELGGMGSSAASTAEMRMTELEDDLAVLLSSSRDAEAEETGGHVYREDTEGYGEYGLGIEDTLPDTAKRLDRLQRRLARELRGRLTALEYERLSGRVSRAAVAYRGDLHAARAGAERAIIELRAEIDAKVAEMDSTS